MTSRLDHGLFVLNWFSSPTLVLVLVQNYINMAYDQTLKTENVTCQIIFLTQNVDPQSRKHICSSCICILHASQIIISLYLTIKISVPVLSIFQESSDIIVYIRKTTNIYLHPLPCVMCINNHMWWLSYLWKKLICWIFSGIPWWHAPTTWWFASSVSIFLLRCKLGLY